MEKGAEKIILFCIISLLVSFGYLVGYLMHSPENCFEYYERTQKVFNKCKGEVLERHVWPSQ